MKVLVGTDIGTYAFNAAAKTVTLTLPVTLVLEDILLITNVTDNLIIYQFNDPVRGGTIAANVITLIYDTTAMSNGDALQIWVNYPGIGQKLSAASMPVVLSSEQEAQIGIVTEVAPVTDTASSGLNGRLQRIAQRLTTLIAFFRLGQGTMAQSLATTIASDQTAVNVKDIITRIQTSGAYEGKTAYVFNVIGQRNGFTSTSAMDGVKEYDNGVSDFAVTSNSTLDIISSSANDTAAGTGVRTVKVTYIDNSNNLVESAAITLNGVALVASVLTGVNQVLWMETATAGSGGVAAGNIRLRINGGVVEVEQITAGGNKSRSAIFMVPTGYTGYLVSGRSSAINNDQDVRIRAQANTLDRTLATTYHYQSQLYTPTNTSNFTLTELWLKLPATCTLKVNTVSAGTAATVRCNVNILIVIIAN